jgi:hypothetical protein
MEPPLQPLSEHLGRGTLRRCGGRGHAGEAQLRLGAPGRGVFTVGTGPSARCGREPERKGASSLCFQPPK